MSASRQDGTYPRPQMCRAGWLDLDGTWAFAYDDDDRGLAQRWFRPDAAERFDRKIVVPYPPESPASGIADPVGHRVLWYRRELAAGMVSGLRTAQRPRVLLHFGAVDFRADVWVDGQHVGHHVGGQAPFTLDITHALAEERDGHVLVVRAEDDPTDTSQPRGKQSWHLTPSKVWYERTSGIWQSVWLEPVPELHVAELTWLADPRDGVHALVEVNGRVSAPVGVTVTLELAGRRIGQASAPLTGRRLRLAVEVPELRNGIDREELTWSPERPVLIDATVSIVNTGTGETVDAVDSYVGVRRVGVGGGRFLLNERPYYLRGVLNQGYRPQTHLANLGTDQLRSEIELAKAMGFNLVRLHQKAEDPRILYWADRLGMLVWGEIGAAYEFTTTAVDNLTQEWVAIVRRDRSHPSIVAWVPVNESWGLPDIADDAAQQDFAGGLARLTRSLDPSRPVMSNEGWEHVDSDILGVHDYTNSAEELTERYGDRARFASELRIPGPAAAGRIPAVTAHQAAMFEAGDAPLIVSEFGGLSLQSASGSFAYTHVSSDGELAALLKDLFAALRSSRAVAGFCYTQLFDTAQETNGLADAGGEPKLPLETVRYVVTGEKGPSVP